MMLLVGVAVGFRPSEPVWSIAPALAVVLALSYTFSWISAFVGLSVKDPETAQSAGSSGWSR
jgi:ABC-2 type transport system permease protein